MGNRIVLRGYVIQVPELALQSVSKTQHREPTEEKKNELAQIPPIAIYGGARFFGEPANATAHRPSSVLTGPHDAPTTELSMGLLLGRCPSDTTLSSVIRSVFH